MWHKKRKLFITNQTFLYCVYAPRMIKEDMTPKKLKEYREKRNVSQEIMADELGVDQSQISRWENGRQAIPVWLDKLIKCLEERDVKRRH